MRPKSCMDCPRCGYPIGRVENMAGCCDAKKEVDIAKKIRVALELAERINKSVAGHDGDEETGAHDEDCQKCMLQELMSCLVEAESDVSD